MLAKEIHVYSQKRTFHERTLNRWLQLPEGDQEALLKLAEALQLGENHFRDFLDWLEEIALRDGTSIRRILQGEMASRVLSDPRLGRSDKLRSLKEQVRRLRFPRLSRIEQEIEQKIRGMKLKPQIQVSVPAGLEGGRLTIQMSATSRDELERLVAELAQVVRESHVKEIFDLLSGREVDAGL